MFMDSVKRDDVKVAAVERAEPKLALAVKHEGRTVAPGAPDPTQELSRVDRWVWTKLRPERFLSGGATRALPPSLLYRTCLPR